MGDKSWWKNIQPLRIQSGWSFLYNKLTDLEPDNLSEDDPAWLFTLVQDILYMRKENRGQTVAHVVLLTKKVFGNFIPTKNESGSHRRRLKNDI